MRFKAMKKYLIDCGVKDVFIRYIETLEEKQEKRSEGIRNLIRINCELENQLMDYEENWEKIKELENNYKRKKLQEIINLYDADYLYEIDDESFNQFIGMLNCYNIAGLKNEFYVSSIDFNDLKGEWFITLTQNSCSLYYYKDQIKTLKKLDKIK